MMRCVSDSAKLKITILGCGASNGVPSLRYGYGDCDSQNLRNNRTRSSILLEYVDTCVLVDMSPDLRFQFLKYDIKKIDAVICTHIHYDHVGGIEELRPLCAYGTECLDIFAMKQTLDQLIQKYGYLFNRTDEIYKPFLRAIPLLPVFNIGNISGISFAQEHGKEISTGLRIKDVAYCTDISNMSEENFDNLSGVKILIIGCLRREERPTHANLSMVLSWIKIINPEIAYLTHMDNSMDYSALCNELPDNVIPAYDGMVIVV